VPERRVLAALAGLALVLGITGHLRRPIQAVPPRIPPERAEPWMADALPGIGPARRDDAAAAIRARDWDRLPAKARAAAREVFAE
jgi:hypothetical protein